MMKRNLMYFLGFTFLSVAMMACKKDNDGTKSSEAQNEEAKATMIGKWERTGITVAGYKDGNLVDADVDDAEILAEVEEGIPGYIELTNSKFILVDFDDDGNREMSYTVDAQTKTITAIDDADGEPTEEDITLLKYEILNGNNHLNLKMTAEGDFLIYDTLEVTIKLKRISSFP